MGSQQPTLSTRVLVDPLYYVHIVQMHMYDIHTYMYKYLLINAHVLAHVSTHLSSYARLHRLLDFRRAQQLVEGLYAEHSTTHVAPNIPLVSAQQ